MGGRSPAWLGCLLAAIGIAPIAGCQRSDVDAGIRVRVLAITNETDAMGAVTEKRQAYPGAKVYLRSHSRTSPSSLLGDDHFVPSDARGDAVFPGIEGYYDVLVDVDDDLVPEERANNVPSGSSLVIEIFRSPDDDVTGPTKKPTDTTTVLPMAKPVAHGMWINGGVTETTRFNVEVTFSARNATLVSLTESPPSSGGKIAYAPGIGYNLSGGQGPKTLYATFYNSVGDFAGPISASIVVKTHLPYPPIASLLKIIMNPPGQSDFLEGLPGAVEDGNQVRIYYDQGLYTQITTTTARVDGSIAPVDIKDNYANREEGSLIYVTAVDVFGRESPPVWIVNDVTPPAMGALVSVWFLDAMAIKIGNNLDVLRVAWRGGDDVVRAVIVPPLYFGDPIELATPSFRGDFVVPADLRYDGPVEMRVIGWDAAGNVGSAGFTHPPFINTKPPDPVTVDVVKGGNRMIDGHWFDYSEDSVAYNLRIRDEEGTIVLQQEIAWLGYMCHTGDIRFYGVDSIFSCFPSYPYGNKKVWSIPGLENCHWYSLEVEAIDIGENTSGYSSPITTYVVIPAPSFAAWGGIADPGSGESAIFYLMSPIQFATAYEVGFSQMEGAPYAYTAPSGMASPVSFATIPTDYGNPAILGLPPGETFFLSSRAHDGTCKSAYSPEVSTNTDLRLVSLFDGLPDQTLGGALSLLGDLNGDGWAEVVVGSTGARIAGAVSAATGSLIQPFGSFFASQDFDLPGTPISSPDITGDGEPDLVVGSPLSSDNGIFLSGTVRVYAAGGGLLASFSGDAEGLQYGYSTAALGDLNGDGFEEFAVGSLGCAHRDCLWTTGTAREGPSKVDIYDGQTLTVMRTHWGTLGDLFGASLAGKFDFDRDGIPDYAIGAPAAIGHGTAAYVATYSGFLGTPHYVYPNVPDIRWGSSLAVTTVNSVGYLFVGSVGATNLDAGYVSAFTFATVGWEPLWLRNGIAVKGGARFGASLAIAGKIDRDAHDDLLVGSPGDIQSFSYGPGSVFVIDTLTGKLHYEVRGNNYDGGLGFSLLRLPNMNSGPAPEWMVGAPGSAYSGYQSGRVYLFSTDPL